MLTNIRQPAITDVNYLFDIDIKCFDDPLEMDVWRNLCLNDSLGKLVGTFYGNPISYIFWDKDMTIFRIAVKAPYRKQGIGTQLLKSVEMAARQQNCSSIKIIVPESLCYPGQPHDVSQWLLHRGFHTQKGILKNSCKYCGQFEDGFIFSVPVGGVK